MTKTLAFDLLFSEISITPLSEKGAAFVHYYETGDLTRPELYRNAVGMGLHVKFNNSKVRDSVAS